MNRRCHDKKHNSYLKYGVKGISVFKEWRSDFKSFYDYCNTLPSYDENNLGSSGLTIDRINNKGNYEPNNIMFTNATMQNFNKGLQANNNTGYRGISKRYNSTYQASI